MFALALALSAQEKQAAKTVPDPLAGAAWALFFADGALLVYDVTDKNSFNKVTRWVAELRDAVGDDITISIAGNKIDLEELRQVDEHEALR